MSSLKQYKTGVAYFMDFEFKVSPDTFIPRPETELLVDKAIETVKLIHGMRPKGVLSEVEGRYTRYDIRNTKYDLRILDIGTGCGNIAISLTKYLPQSKIIALDISHSALLKARKNAEMLDVSDKVTFLESDLLGALKEKGLFDIIICNPPYVSEKDMCWLPDEVREEPYAALYGGRDGLNFYRRIVKDAKPYLKKDGFLLMETGYDQSESVKALLEDNGYINIEIFKDYSRIDRILKAKVR